MKEFITFALKTRFIRFLCTGGINTIVTYAIYMLLLQAFNYQASYTIAYVAGIAIAYLLNKVFVFKMHQGWKSVMLFPLVYLIQYLFGILVLWLLVSQLGLSVELGPLVVVILSVPLTYWLSRFAFVGLESEKNSVIRAK